MIKEVMLNRFGKFTDTRFTLAEVTVFAGKNEAGKTTLFDALFYVLCKPRATKKIGRELKERYGECMEVKIHPPQEDALFDEDEFLNLYAIRSGNIDLDLAANASWMERVKTRLFTGGLDPLKLRDRFDTLASSKGSLKHNRELNQLVKENTLLKTKLGQLQEKRNSFLNRQNVTARMKLDLNSLKNQIETKTNELKALEKHWETTKKAKEKAFFISILSRIDQAAKRKIRRRELGIYSESEINTLDNLQTNLGEVSRNLDLLREKQKAGQHNLAELEQKLLEEQTVYKKQQALADQAALYITQINSFLAGIPQKKVTVWNKVLLLCAVFPVAASLIPLFFLSHPVLQVVLPLIGLLVSVILVLLARKERTLADEEKITAYLQWLKDDWQNRGNPALNSGTLQSLADELQGIRHKCDALQEKLNAYEEEKLKNSKLLIRTEQEIQEKSGLQEKSNRTLVQWLADHRVKNRDEYLKQTIEYSRLKQEEEAWVREFAGLMQSYHFTEPDKFEAYASAKVRELETEAGAYAFPGEVPADMEIARIESEYKARQRELDNLKQKFGTLNTLAAQESGKLSGSLGSLSVEIVETEKIIQENRSKIEKLNIKREAAVLTRNIFEAIARDSESVMVELSKELAAQFGKIVPEFREVELPELKTHALRITDRTGQLRQVEHLSRGTKDAFLFAARLALARKANQNPGLLILDEPFTSLDEDRLRTSLDLVKLFYEETGWQLIFFTKDEPLTAIVQEKFANALVNRL